MSDFVSSILKKKINSHNIFTRVESLERMGGAKPSTYNRADSLEEIANDIGIGGLVPDQGILSRSAQGNLTWTTRLQVDGTTGNLNINGLPNSPFLTLTGPGCNYIEFNKTGVDNRRCAVGALGTIEMNISYNMDYSSGQHDYYDSAHPALWLALNDAGLYFQYAPAGLSPDIWDNAGQVYPWKVLVNGNMSIQGSFDTNGDAARSFQMNRSAVVGGAGNMLTILSGGCKSGSTDQPGGTLKLAAGIATGTGSSQVQVWMSPAGTTGTADNSLVQVGTFTAHKTAGHKFGISETTPTESGDFCGRAIKIGANSSNFLARTNANNKAGYLVGSHYTYAEESVFLLGETSVSGTNTVFVGGGSTDYNAATIVAVYTASNGTTPSGTEALRINSAQNLLLGTTTDGMTASGSLAIAKDLAHRGTKAGFFNVAPVVQQTKAGHNNWAAISDVTAALAALGLIDAA